MNKYKLNLAGSFLEVWIEAYSDLRRRYEWVRIGIFDMKGSYGLNQHTFPKREYKTISGWKKAMEREVECSIDWEDYYSVDWIEVEEIQEAFQTN